MSDSVQGTVRKPFRMLGWVVGPIMAIGGVWILGDSILTLINDGWAAFRANSDMTALGVGSLSLAILILRAAATGWDPYVHKDE